MCSSEDTFRSLHELAFQYCNKTPELDNLNGEKVMWTQFQKFQSVIEWPCCLWAF